MINKIRYTLAALFIATASWAYLGGVTKPHNHTSAAGDGGRLSNLVVGTSLTSSGPLSLTGATQSTPTDGFNRVTQSAYSVNPSSINLTSNTFYIPNHGLWNASAALVTSTGTLPLGLTANTTYFISWVDGSDIALSSSVFDASNGVYVVLVSSGNANTIITPLPEHTLATFENGVPAVWISSGMYYSSSAQTLGPQIFIGGRTEPTQPSELLHIEGTGAVPSDTAADVALYALGGQGSRFIANASSGPLRTNEVLTYLNAYGSAASATLFSGGPSFKNASTLEFQNASNVLFRNFGGPANSGYYFWTDEPSGVFNFYNGTTWDLAITSSTVLVETQFALPGWNKAQIRTLSPNQAVSVVGCADCTTTRICVSTGSAAGQWAAANFPNLTTACQ